MAEGGKEDTKEIYELALLPPQEKKIKRPWIPTDFR